MRRQIVVAPEAQRFRREVGIDQDPGVAGSLRDTQASDQVTPDDYKDRLLKHIPAEAVAVYLTLDGIIRSSAEGNQLEVALWIAFGLGLVGTPLYLWRLQGVARSLQLVVSTLSFAIWVFALGGPYAQYNWYEPWIASVVLVGFTFVIPLFLGQARPEPG
jgi:hypothetical protein